MSEPRITRYTLDAFPYGVNAGLWCINVEETSEGMWAVRWHSMCLNRRTKQWDYEPTSSNRSKRFLSTHRFPLDQALALAKNAFPKSKLNGRTAEEVMSWAPSSRTSKR